MRINIVSIFPGFFEAPLGLSIPARAAEAGVDLFDHQRATPMQPGDLHQRGERRGAHVRVGQVDREGRQLPAFRTEIQYRTTLMQQQPGAGDAARARRRSSSRGHA